MFTQKVGNVFEVDGDVAAALLKLQDDESQESPKQQRSKKKILRPQQKLLTDMFSNLEPTGTSTPSSSLSRVTNCETLARMILKRQNEISRNKKRDSFHESNQEGQITWSEDHISKLSNQTMKTQDIATQTEDEYKPQTPLEKMEAIIKLLCAKLETFETQTSSSEKSPDADRRQQRYSLSDDVIDLTASPDSTEEYVRSAECNSYSGNIPLEGIKKEIIYESSENEEGSFRIRIAETSPTEKIGKGETTVPCRVLRRIDWSRYQKATRQLLKAVFSRKILATHNLSGMRRATSSRPAKKALDEDILDDVIETLVERCKVSKSDVRKCITQTCNDEVKAYHTQRNKKRRRLNEDAGAEELTSSSSEN